MCFFFFKLLYVILYVIMSISDVIWGRKHQLSAGSCLAHSCHAWILMAVSMSQTSQNLQKMAVAQNYNENICEFHEFHRNATFGSCPNALNISIHFRLISFCPWSFRNCPRCQLSHFSCYIRTLIGHSILPEPWIPLDTDTWGYTPDLPDPTRSSQRWKWSKRMQKPLYVSCEWWRRRSVRSTCTVWRSARRFLDVFGNYYLMIFDVSCKVIEKMQNQSQKERSDGLDTVQSRTQPRKLLNSNNLELWGGPELLLLHVKVIVVRSPGGMADWRESHCDWRHCGYEEIIFQWTEGSYPFTSPSKKSGRHSSAIKVGVECTNIRNGRTLSPSIFYADIARRFRWCHCSPLLCVPRHVAGVICYQAAGGWRLALTILGSGTSVAPRKEIVATQDTPRPFIPCWPSVGLYVDKRALDVNSEPEKERRWPSMIFPNILEGQEGFSSPSTQIWVSWSFSWHTSFILVVS